jgi:mRNA interferase RelE/StbE
LWKIQYSQKAAISILKLNTVLRNRIRSGVEKQSDNPDLGKRLTGPLKGLSSLRIGDYRIIYRKENEELTILVAAIGHRKKIYK